VLSAFIGGYENYQTPERKKKKEEEKTENMFSEPHGKKKLK